MDRQTNGQTEKCTDRQMAAAHDAAEERERDREREKKKKASERASEIDITVSLSSSLLPDGSDARGLPSEPAPRLPCAARGELSALMRGEFSDRVSTAGLRPDGLADTKRGVYVPSSSSASCLGVDPPSPRVGAGGAGDGRGSVRGNRPNSSLPRTPPQLAPIDPSPPPLPAASISSRSIPDRGAARRQREGASLHSTPCSRNLNLNLDFCHEYDWNIIN